MMPWYRVAGLMILSALRAWAGIALTTTTLIAEPVPTGEEIEDPRSSIAPLNCAPIFHCRTNVHSWPASWGRTSPEDAIHVPITNAFAAEGVGLEAAAARGTTGFVSDATVVSRGQVIGRGTVDVRATVEGIESGGLAPRDIFRNDQGLLPRQGPGYYQEFVQPTPGVSGARPQRIIRGQGGELYYTPDHYRTFIPLN